MKDIEKNYSIAKELFKEINVDCDKCLEMMDQIPISIPCWQLDDISGFEIEKTSLSGGIAVTGENAGKPESKKEYFKMMDKVLAAIPGPKRIALHAMYLEDFGEVVDRNQIEPKHFDIWIQYAKKNKIGLDFNPTYFSHSNLKEGFTLASIDKNIRDFWIEHGKRSRKIGEYIGQELKTTCYTNHWIPDGYKDQCIDKVAPRVRLKQSLDEIFAEKIDEKYNVDSVESKLFGIGSESYVVGSHEFYTNYVMCEKKAIICLDAGHYHPTEYVSDKISSYLTFNQEIMLHVSRPVRWDSDHIVSLDDETLRIMKEIARADAFDNVHIGLDFFDGSVNRVEGLIQGSLSVKKAIMIALLEPIKELKEFENKSDYTSRLKCLEEIKMLPYGFVWDKYCAIHGIKE